MLIVGVQIRFIVLFCGRICLNCKSIILLTDYNLYFYESVVQWIESLVSAQRIEVRILADSFPKELLKIKSKKLQKLEIGVNKILKEELDKKNIKYDLVG